MTNDTSVIELTWQSKDILHALILKSCNKEVRSLDLPAEKRHIDTILRECCDVPRLQAEKS